MTSTCQQQGLSPSNNLPAFDAKLADIVKRASEVRAYFFINRDPDPKGSVQTSSLRQIGLSAPDVLDRLRQLVFSDGTYRSATGVKIDASSPFVPSFGFEFTEDNNSAWWLVSELSQTATLVSREAPWRRPGIRNLKPESVAAFRQLLGSPK